MIVVPGTTPVTSPEKETIDATEVLLEVHEPPLDPSTRVTVGLTGSVTQEPEPVIGTGNGLTVTCFVAVQPVGKVYVIVAVPVVTVVMPPEVGSMVAMAVLLIDHVPPAVASEKF